MRKLFVTIFIALPRLLVAAFMIGACSSAPPAPTPWFNEHIHINDPVLPAGVEFNVIQDYGNKSVDSTDSLLITNMTSVPLLLAALPPPEPSYYHEDINCPGENLCLKAVSGRAYKWGILNLDPPWQYGWLPVDEFEETAPLSLHIYGTSLGTTLEYTVLWIDLRNEYTQSRPENVSVPEPQEVAFPYLYDSEPKWVSLTISYSLNESYAVHEPFPWTVCLAPIALALVFFLVFVAVLFNRLLVHLEKRAKTRQI